MTAIIWYHGNLRLEYETDQIADVYHVLRGRMGEEYGEPKLIGKIWLNSARLWTAETVNGDNCGTSYLTPFYAADHMRLFLRLK